MSKCIECNPYGTPDDHRDALAEENKELKAKLENLSLLFGELLEASVPLAARELSTKDFVHFMKVRDGFRG